MERSDNLKYLYPMKVDDTSAVYKIPPKKMQKIRDSKAEAEQQYKCEKCARSYSQKKNLNRHKKYECGGIRMFVCQFCFNRFKYKDYLRRHIDRMHLKTDANISDGNHNCDQCSRSYRVLSSLNRHKRLDHVEFKQQVQCDDCGFTSSHKQNLLRHIRLRHL